MAQRQQIPIKVKCNGVIRLLKIPRSLSYDGLYDLLTKSFGVTKCQLQYRDEEGDLVELGSQEEMQEALKVADKLGPLKISIITCQNAVMMSKINKTNEQAQLKDELKEMNQATSKLHICVKAKCKGVTRLLKVPRTSSFQSFCSLLKCSYGLSQCQLHYSGKNGDLLQLNSQEDLQGAFKVADKIGSLKVAITTDENPLMCAKLTETSQTGQSNSLPLKKQGISKKQTQEVPIKVHCKGLIRLLKIPRDLLFENFFNLLKISYGLKQGQLKFCNKKGDMVELDCQEKLDEALQATSKLGPLKVTVITDETPSMNYTIIKASDFIQSTHAEVVQTQSNERQTCRENITSPNGESGMLVEPLSGLIISEKPTPKPRPNRKRMGFYTSLCSEMAGLDIGSSSSEASSHGPKTQENSREKMKAKQLQGSQYYLSLADDIVTLCKHQEIESIQMQPTPNRPQVKLQQSSGQPVSEENGALNEEDSKTLCKEEEPPKWLNEVVHRMTQSVSTRVLDALSGAVATSAGDPCPLKPAKRASSSCIHEGIACKGCYQIIVGPRYKCGNCPDYDLCEQCETIESIHDASHVFVKLRYPVPGIGRKHGVMIPLLKDIIYKSKDVKLAEEQDRRMKEVRMKLKQLAKKKREEQVRMKKAEKKMKKLKGGSNAVDSPLCGLELVFIGDGNYPDGTQVIPEFEFTKCWKVRNGGSIAWNHEMKLVRMYGEIRSVSTEVPLPHLQPGEEGTVNVTFIASAEPGQYYSLWRASHHGKNFGSKVWCKIEVVLDEVETDNDDDEILVHANDAPFVNSGQDSSETNEIEENSEELEEFLQTPEDAAPNFHTYTVLYPPQETSPDYPHSSVEESARQTDTSALDSMELEWDTCVVEEGSSQGLEEDAVLVNEDDGVDIEVISNASSDDFFVVPLPDCFNPDIPLGACADDAIDAEESSVKVDDLGKPINRGNLMESDYEPASNEPEIVDSREGIESLGMSSECTSDSQEVPGSHNIKVDTKDSTGRKDDEGSPLYIDIPTRTERSNRRLQTLPEFHASSAISAPVAPQPFSLERHAFVPGRLPPSPPGRAVPVLQAELVYPEPEGRQTISIPRCDEMHASDDSTDSAVKIQPFDVPRGYDSHQAVTSQPQAVFVSPSGLNQLNGQFSTALVAGTLKRAIGTVADTVSSFMTGKENTAAVSNPPNDEKERVRVTGNNELVEENQGEETASTRDLMQKLQEMGFCDRRLNERLLKKCNNNLSQVVTQLLHENDNDWSTGRHSSN